MEAWKNVALKKVFMQNEYCTWTILHNHQLVCPNIYSSSLQLPKLATTRIVVSIKDSKQIVPFF